MYNSINLNTESFYLDAKDDFNKNQLNTQNLPSYLVKDDVESSSGNLKKWAKIELQSQLTETEYFQKLNDVKLASTSVNLVQPSFTTMNGDELYMSSYLYVKLNQANDFSLLQQEANNKNLLIIEQNQFMPLWYTLRLTGQTNDHTLNISNYLYSTGNFSAVEPDFIYEDYIQCSNDPLFSDQWGLNNTTSNVGNDGIDIDVCNAWDFSTGSNINVAVIDSGIDLNHPDLVNNLSSLSYNAASNTSPSNITSSHGTAVAGIIGAEKDNSIGIAGVAPDCNLMSASVEFGTNRTNEQLADAINWSVENGADVLNNSWGGSSPSNIISDAITNAVNNGRNGLGCIVVFSSGNDNASVSYPANSNSKIIAVGAISPCGERKNPNSCDGEDWWGSNYGSQLNIVAPGVLIPTTDRVGFTGYSTNDYTMDFNGTSSSAPYVSGVAALILAANPNLTSEEVTNIIETTALKVGAYTYPVERPNGNWNNEMGYGLIDAHMSVLFALEDGDEVEISGPEILCVGEQATFYANYEVDWSFSSASSGYIFTTETNNRSWVTIESVGTNNPNFGFSAYLVARRFATDKSKFIKCDAPRFALTYEDNSRIKVNLTDIINNPIDEQGITEVEWELTSGNSNIFQATDEFGEFSNSPFTGKVTLTNAAGSTTLPFFWPDPNICYSLLKMDQDRYQVIDRCNENQIVDNMNIKEIYNFYGNKISDIPINNQDLDITNIGNSGDLQIIIISVDGQNISKQIIKD